MTFVLVLFSWVLFRSETFHEAARYFGFMFGAGGASDAAALLAAEFYAPGKIILMALCAALIVRPLQAYEWAEDVTWPKALALAPTFCLALMAMFAQSFSPFLYFRF